MPEEPRLNTVQEFITEMNDEVAHVKQVRNHIQESYDVDFNNAQADEDNCVQQIKADGQDGLKFDLNTVNGLCRYALRNLLERGAFDNKFESKVKAVLESTAEIDYGKFIDLYDVCRKIE